jgi:hypothetical protein
MLEPFEVLSLVGGAIVPFFDAVSMLQVFSPLPSVAGAISSSVYAVAMRFIVLPLALVYVSIGMDESAAANRAIIDPVSLVEREIGPYLFALAIAHAVAELADVHGSVFHLDGTLGDEWRQVFIVGLEGTNLNGDFLSDVIVEVFGLEAVVFLRVEDEGVLGLVLHSLAGFALISHVG